MLDDATKKMQKNNTIISCDWYFDQGLSWRPPGVKGSASESQKDCWLNQTGMATPPSLPLLSALQDISGHFALKSNVAQHFTPVPTWQPDDKMVCRPNIQNKNKNKNKKIKK